MPTTPTNPDRLPPVIIVVALIATLSAAGVLTWFFGFRDTWEADNAFRIRQLAEATIAFKSANQEQEAFKNAVELDTLVGQRRLNDPQLRDLVERSRTELRPLLEAAATKRRRDQIDAIARSVNEALDGATLALEKGDLNVARDGLRKAESLIGEGKPSPGEADDALRRTAAFRTRLAEREAAVRAEAERAREAKARAAELAKLRVTVSGGAWVTRKPGNSDPLRGLEIYFMPSMIPAASAVRYFEAVASSYRVSLEVDENSLEERQKRLRSAEYESVREVWRKSVAEIESRIADSKLGLSIAELGLAASRAKQADELVDSTLLRPRGFRDPPDGVTRAWIELAQSAAIGKASTSVDGKYNLTLPGGMYLAVARAETEYWRMSWAIPVTLDGADPKQLDFHNATADLVENTNDK